MSREHWLVVGLGLSGYWGARLILQRENPAALRVCEGLLTPEKERRAEELHAVCNKVGCSFDVEWMPEPRELSQVQRVVISPGVPWDLPWLNEARERGIEVIGEMELAFRHTSIPLIAITGTNGKTTTTALVAHILNRSGIKAWVGGNIGDPLSHFVVEGEDADWIVLEVSSFQLETVRDFHPKVAAVLNIAEDHLDRYPSMAAYAQAKERMLLKMDQGDTVVANADDAAVMEMVHRHTRPRVLTFSSGPRGGGVHSTTIGVERGDLVFQGEPLVPLEELDLQTRMNLPNVMAALLCANSAGVDPRRGIETVKGFRWQPHRTEVVHEANGITFVDDSKATNPAAVEHALRVLEGPIILLMGGRNKGFRFGSLLPFLEEKTRAVLLFGEAAEEIERDLVGARVETRGFSKMEESVAEAVEMAVPGDTVLLSPGCASFDEFESYVQRGEAFKTLVRSLA